jgi:hypothetical protein
MYASVLNITLTFETENLFRPASPSCGPVCGQWIPVMNTLFYRIPCTNFENNFGNTTQKKKLTRRSAIRKAKRVPFIVKLLTKFGLTQTT